MAQQQKPKLDLTQVEEAIRAVRFMVTRKNPGFTIMSTCAPGKDARYNRYVMFTHKIRNDTTNEIMCYITYRCKLPLKEEAPIFSSYEIFNDSYMSLNKFHVDYSDGSLGRKTFDEVYAYISSLLK